MLKNDGGVAGWSLCSRTPHDETVLGGRAQFGPSQLPRENDGSMRPSLRRSASRRARVGWVRTGNFLIILRDDSLSIRMGDFSSAKPLHHYFERFRCLLKRGTA